MSGSPEKSLQEIVDAYSPIVRGKKGPLGLLLKIVARPLELLRNIVGAVARFPIGFGHENKAGQILTDCPAIVPDTFKRMEKKLQRSFNTASRRDASPIERETFLQLAENVRADGDMLAKHCTILRTEFSSVTEPYNFVVEKTPLGNRAFKTVSLEQGVALVKEQMSSLVSDLAARISDGAQNPVTIRRKPIELQSRPQAGV